MEKCIDLLGNENVIETKKNCSVPEKIPTSIQIILRYLSMYTYTWVNVVMYACM